MFNFELLYLFFFITPVVVYFSGLYKPKNVAIVMSIAALALVMGTVIPKYPAVIKGILVGYTLAFLLYHLLIIVLRKFNLINL